MKIDCDGRHRIHVAEIVGVPEDGKIVVVTVCLDCGDVAFTEKTITTPGSQLQLMLEEKGKAK